jgi:phosphoglycolate phosphatase-like HAD superfamily hydrolase
MINHVAFDLDGTLLDTRRQISRSLFETIPRAHQNAKAMEAIEKAFGASPLGLLRAYGVNSLSNYWRAHERNAKFCQMCSSDTLAELKRLRSSGITLSVLTSLPTRAAATLLKAHQLADLFQRIDGAGSLNFKKPSPRALLTHLGQMGVDAERAAYVGDDVKDMEMSSNANVFAIGVKWSILGAAALQRAGAKAILNRFADITVVLK